MIPVFQKHKKKVAFFSPAIILLAFFGNTILLGDKSRESSIRIVPGAERYELNEFFSASIDIDVNTAINALEGALTYPTDLLEVTGISTEDSFIDLWIIEPTYSNTAGTIHFTGGSTGAGGFIGPGHVTTVFFKTLKPGAVKLSFTDARILAHDGIGTDIVDRTIDADFIVNQFQNAGGEEITHQEDADFVVTPETAPNTDVNGDGTTNLKDISVFTVGMTGSYIPEYDFNLDGEVGLKDMSIILSDAFDN